MHSGRSSNSTHRLLAGLQKPLVGSHPTPTSTVSPHSTSAGACCLFAAPPDTLQLTLFPRGRAPRNTRLMSAFGIEDFKLALSEGCYSPTASQPDPQLGPIGSFTHLILIPFEAFTHVQDTPFILIEDCTQVQDAYWKCDQTDAHSNNKPPIQASKKAQPEESKQNKRS